MIEIDEVLVRHAAMIERIVSDKSAQQLFADLSTHYGNQWKTATTPEKREDLWQKQRALDELWNEFQRVVASGQAEAARANPRQV